MALFGVGFLVLYPIVMLFLFSFQVGAYGQPTTLGLDNWRTALTERSMQSAIVNTLTLTFARQGIALAIGIVLAWTLARTNLPARGWLEFGFWIVFFLPTLPVLLGWIVLLDGHSGILNQLSLRLPFIQRPLFDIFSWWGIVFAHLMINTLVLKVMLLTPAFRNMDASLEEASHVNGAALFTTVRRIVVPIVLPSIVVVTLLGVVQSLQAFEIELILGAPSRINVYSTVIYQRVFASPPEYGAATALSMIVLMLIAPFILFQQWFVRRRSFASVSGKFSTRPHDLGRWRWPVFGVVASLLGVMTLLPVSFLLVGTFMRRFGYLNIPNAWTTRNWTTVLTDSHFFSALWDTLSIGFSASVLSMLFFSVIAYIVLRTRLPGKGLLDFLTWLPITIPGIVIGLGFLWLFLKTPLLRPLYGTEIGLILALMTAGMALGVQIIKSGMAQLSKELEEASWASGGTMLYTLRRIVIPLIAPTVAAVGILTFVTATRTISTVVLLSSRATQPLSILQLNYMEGGDYEAATVIGVILLLLTTGVALLARVAGLRFGPAGH